MKKKHNSAVRRAYLLPLLQILIFQNYLMINVSCVRKEEWNATTKRYSQLQLKLMKLLSSFSLLPSKGLNVPRAPPVQLIRERI